jgi:hypothetical protein
VDKEKQIEGMAEVLRHVCEGECIRNKDGLIDCEVCKACHLYEAGYRKQSEWISADNPPKTYRDEYGELIPFLVCCRGTVHPFRAMYDGKNWGDGIGRLNVTHWMPLPEPPQMKGGAE